jgi:transaldolase/glucose-6-phosphate isomerase
LKNAEKMRQACQPDVPVSENPGVLLGILLGVLANRGKDKVTLILSPGIKALGAWLEQLLAESTGKKGKGLIPIDRESVGDSTVYENDRVFVYIRLAADPDHDQSVDHLERSGFAVIRLFIEDKMHLGGELFRWEVF